jgi:hypothetical protein
MALHLVALDRSKGRGNPNPLPRLPSLPPSLGIDSCSGPWHLVSATIFVAVRTGCGWARGGAAGGAAAGADGEGGVDAATG